MIHVEQGKEYYERDCKVSKLRTALGPIVGDFFGSLEKQTVAVLSSCSNPHLVLASETPTTEFEALLTTTC